MTRGRKLWRLDIELTIEGCHRAGCVAAFRTRDGQRVRMTKLAALHHGAEIDLVEGAHGVSPSRVAVIRVGVHGAKIPGLSLGLTGDQS